MIQVMDDATAPACLQETVVILIRSTYASIDDAVGSIVATIDALASSLDDARRLSVQSDASSTTRPRRHVSSNISH